VLLNQAVDTVYAKLLARGEKTTKLYTLIEESDDIVLEEVESEFLAQGQFNALSKLYERAGVVEKQLELWSKFVTHFSESDRALKPHSGNRIADGQWSDDDIPDPLTNIFVLLAKHRDWQLVQKWTAWLTSKDPARAVKV